MRLKIILAAEVIALGAAGATAGIIAAVSRLSPALVAVCLGEWLVIEAVLIVGVFDWRSPIFGRIFWKGPRNLRALALTFDDGPNEPYTSRVLEILESFDVKAAFFMIGENVERFPEAARRVARKGHEIGNHGYDHGVLPLRSPAHIRGQIARTNEVIEAATGSKPAYFRAPHGWRSPWLDRAARRAGCVPVSWTLGVWDTSMPGAAAITERALRGLSNGCVVLLHDGRGTEHGTDSSQLVEALPGIIRGAREAGYRFLSLSEMVEEARKR
jgi:peptidoglycan/xylan/chitin deacetylase (PgdA/CDA1 family)